MDEAELLDHGPEKVPGRGLAVHRLENKSRFFGKAVGMVEVGGEGQGGILGHKGEMQVGHRGRGQVEKI